jgi:hypothetical protein
MIEVGRIRRRSFVTLAAMALMAICSPARAEDPVEIRIVIRDHKFEPAQIEVPPGRELKLIVTNADTTPEEFESVGLKIERIIPPGGTAEFKVRPLLAHRNYKFFGEFHQDTAQGQIVVK